MLRLLLIRHGQSTMNAQRRVQGWLDPPLDNTGWMQAQAIARRLCGRPLEAVYSSDLRRALETAQAVADAVGRPVMVDPRLRERDTGDLSGLTPEEIRHHFPDVVRSWEEGSSNLPGAEPLEVFRERVLAAFADIVARYPQGEVAVVSHGGPINVYITHLLGGRPGQRLPIRLTNASLSIVEWENGRPQISLLNDCCHLEGL